MYLTQKDVENRYKVSRTTLWRWTKDGRFPEPRYFFGQKRWSIEELEDWESR